MNNNTNGQHDDTFMEFIKIVFDAICALGSIFFSIVFFILVMTKVYFKSFSSYSIFIKIISLFTSLVVGFIVLISCFSFFEYYSFIISIFFLLAVLSFFAKFFKPVTFDSVISAFISKFDMEGMLSCVNTSKIENKAYVSLDSELTAQEFEKQLKQKFEHFTGLDILEVKRGQSRGTIMLVVKLFDYERKNLSDIEDDFVEDLFIFLNDLLSWNIRRCPHGLIVGGVGSGKTFFVAYLMIGLLKIKAKLFVADPKNSGLMVLKKYLGDDVVKDVDDVLDLIVRFEKMMNDRYEEMSSRDDFVFDKDYVDYNLEPLIFVFDEFVAFISLLDNKVKDQVNKSLKQIILKGRQAGCFMILATQRPDAKYLEGGIRDMLGLRVALGNCSNDGYKMAFGDEGKGLKNNGVTGSGFIYLDGITDYPEFYESPFIDMSFEEEFARLHGLNLEFGKVNLLKDS